MGRIFREPEGGRRAWVFVLIGCYFLVETIFFRDEPLGRLVYLAFGLGVLGLGAADLLPRNQTRTAGTLRTAGVALIGLVVAIRAVQLIALAV